MATVTDVSLKGKTPRDCGFESHHRLSTEALQVARYPRLCRKVKCRNRLDELVKSWQKCHPELGRRFDSCTDYQHFRDIINDMTCVFMGETDRPMTLVYERDEQGMIPPVGV